MSYARCDLDSDVYVIKDVRGGWTCFCRDTIKGDFVNVGSLEELKAHLEQHVTDGLRVPAHTFERIEREIKETLR